MAKVGRPSTYNPNLDFARLAEDYLQTCGREQTKLPKLSEFCREVLHISQDAVEDWLKLENTEELSGAIKRVKEAQMEQLMDDGLYGGKEVNTAMAIFQLKANHNMIESDRHIIETKGSLIDVEDDGKTEIHTVSTVPAKTN